MKISVIFDGSTRLREHSGKANVTISQCHVESVVSSIVKKMQLGKITFCRLVVEQKTLAGQEAEHKWDLEKLFNDQANHPSLCVFVASLMLAVPWNLPQ